MWVVMGLAAVLAGVPEATAPPNVVLIVADDLGYGDVGFLGRTEWATPQLDRLARRGTVLNRFYASGCVCGPSRAALMSGQSTIRSGVRRNGDDLPAEAITMAEALVPHGYATALYGKWHRGEPRPGATEAVHPLDQGFQSFFGFLDPYHAAEKYPTSLWDGRQRVPSTGYADDLFTDRAVAFLERQGDAGSPSPFLLVVSYTAPHHAIVAPDEEVDQHRSRLPEPDASRPNSAHYAGMITRLDHNVGRVLETLDRLDLAERTLVVFTSDHGATFEEANLGTSAALASNGPLRGQKRTLWEGGLRVPTIVAWPGTIPAGVVSEAIGQHADFLPTFLAAVGGAPDPSWNLDGVDLLPSWRGEGPPADRTLFWEYRDEGVDQLAALRGDLKLVVNRGGPPELYDVAADPGEQRDLSASRPQVVERLHRELREWISTATNLDLPDADVAGDIGAPTPHERSGVEAPAPQGGGGSLVARIASSWLDRSGVTGTTAEPDSPDDKPNAELSALQGRWVATAGRNGALAVELEVSGDRAVFRVETPEGLVLNANGSMVFNPSTDGPPALDWVGFRTANGLPLPTIPSIYHIDGDTFTVCSGGPNGARPIDFAPGDGPLADLVTFRRLVPDLEIGSTTLAEGTAEHVR